LKIKCKNFFDAQQQEQAVAVLWLSEAVFIAHCCHEVVKSHACNVLRGNHKNGRSKSRPMSLVSENLGDQMFCEILPNTYALAQIFVFKFSRFHDSLFSKICPKQSKPLRVNKWQKWLNQ
jgi:hypothetical protein